MSNDEPLYVECGPQGKRVAAVVCCHMIESSQPVGFVENSSEPNDLQAWCKRCEEMFLAEGDKTEAFEAFNDRAIVCCVCHNPLKTKHSKEDRRSNKRLKLTGAAILVFQTSTFLQAALVVSLGSQETTRRQAL